MSSPEREYRVLDAGTTDSGAVIANVDPAENVEVNRVVADTDVDVASESGSVSNEIERNRVNGDSYASRTAELQEPPRRQHTHNNRNNEVPNRLRSAFFTPARSTSARSVFDALKAADITPREVACMQRRMNGEVVITFKDPETKEKFLRLNSLSVDGNSFAVQDIDRPLTYLTIYDAPFELSELAIINRLAPYCDVLHYRCGRFDFMPGVCNGLRHYRVRVIKPIPSFLRFGKLLLFLKHDGQVPTCRRCNRPGHFSYQCVDKICFNCEQLGHEAPACPAPMLCSICKSDQHLGRRCPYSWYAVSPSRVSGDASPRAEAEDDRESVDSLRWLMTIDLSDDENEADKTDENLENEKNDKIDENEKNDENNENEEIIENGNDEIIEHGENDTNVVNDPTLDDRQLMDTTQASSVEENAQRSALDSQGLLQSPDPPDVTLVQRPSLPASDSPQVTPEVIVLNSPPHPASDAPSSAAEPTSDPVPSSCDPAPSSSDPVPESAQDPTPPLRLRGRRAPAPLPEALSGLQRKVTSPVLVTSRPRSAEDHNDEDSMDTSINLKRKSAPPKSAGKKGRKKGVYLPGKFLSS